MHWTEIFGFVTGALAVWWAVKEKVINWPVGILNSGFWLILFWQQTLYYNSGLQVVYIAIALFGWYWWLHGGNDKTELPVRHTSLREAALLSTIAVIGTAVFVYLEVKLFKSVAPFWDASTTVVSLIAQYMLAKKMFENWFLWMSVDIVYFILYWNLGIKLTASLQVIFFIMCLCGVVQWSRTLHPKNRMEMVMA